MEASSPLDTHVTPIVQLVNAISTEESQVNVRLLFLFF